MVSGIAVWVARGATLTSGVNANGTLSWKRKYSNEKIRENWRYLLKLRKIISYSEKSYVILQGFHTELGMNINLVYAPSLTSLALLTEFNVSGNYYDCPRLYLRVISMKVTPCWKWLLGNRLCVFMCYEKFKYTCKYVQNITWCSKPYKLFKLRS